MKQEQEKDVLRAALDSIGDGFIVLDPEYRVTFLGRVDAERMRAAGMNPDELIGRSIWDVLPAATHSEMARLLGEVKQQRTARIIEAQFGGRWFEGRAYPTGDGGVVVLSLDITERKSAEQQLAVSETKFSTMFEAAPFAMSLTELPEGVIADVNPAFLELLGLKRHEAIGKTALELGLHEEPRPRGPLRQQLLRGGVVRDAQTTLRTKAGELVTLSNNVDLVELGGKRYMLSTLRDVTAQRAAERALRDSERHFRFLADNLPQMIWTARADGTIDYRNARWYELTARPPGTLGIEHSRPFVHPDDFPGALRAWQQSLNTGEPYQHELRYLDRASGSYRWYLASAVALRDAHGHVSRWFGSLTDIQTQREAAEKLGETLRLREDFLAVAGHELKTPLTALLMHVQSLQRAAEKENASAGMKERLLKTSRAARRLDKLINELLDVSRITAGHLQLETEPVDLVALVRDVVTDFGDRTPARIVVRSSEASLPGTWDPLRVEQVVSNLVENALKYGQGRPVELELSREDDDAVLRVTDHGIGISPVQQERIFRRFERAVSAREYGGLGLGLWISRQIVEASGGEVQVESAPGEGATFTVRLPLQPSIH